jgi:F-type H+-transporting ATPase subunit a
MSVMANPAETTAYNDAESAAVEASSAGEHASPIISIKPEVIFHAGDVPVTNSMFIGSVTAVLFILLAIALHRSLKEVPGKLQGWFETIMEQGLGIMDTILGTRETSLRYFPLIATIFLFVLASNWLGLLPLTHVLVNGHAPVLRAPTADLNFTIGLAVISVLAVNLLGVAAIGIGPHLRKFLVNPFKDPIGTFVGLLELVSEFVKIISFSFRLFGNVFAGEVLLTIVAFLVPYVVPLPFLFLEVFVGLIQAFIFAMLTLVFLSMSTVAHDHAEAHH